VFDGAACRIAMSQFGSKKAAPGNIHQAWNASVRNSTQFAGVVRAGSVFL
jgi:hypothetical protein